MKAVDLRFESVYPLQSLLKKQSRAVGHQDRITLSLFRVRVGRRQEEISYPSKTADAVLSAVLKGGWVQV